MTDIHKGNYDHLDVREEIAFLHWQDSSLIQLPVGIGWHLRFSHGGPLSLVE